MTWPADLCDLRTFETVETLSEGSLSTFPDMLWESVTTVGYDSSCFTSQAAVSGAATFSIPKLEVMIAKVLNLQQMCRPDM